MEFSAEQKSFIELCANSAQNIVFEACAGGGKTTTMIAGGKEIRGSQTIAFNKKNADELAKRGVKNSSTCHSAGFALLRREFGRVRVDNWRINKVLEGILPGSTEHKRREAWKVRGAIEWVQNCYPVNPTQQEIEEGVLCSGLTPDGEGMEKISRYVNEALLRLAEWDGTICFQDMCWLPLQLGLKGNAPSILIDEFQDLNLCQILLAESLAPEGRRIAIGDSYQAIYGFRGALEGGMEQMLDRWNADLAALTYTFRCPKSVVALAQEDAPHLKAPEWAQEGSVTDLPYQDALEKMKAGDVLLSRVNAPLFSTAMAFLENHRPVTILGNDSFKKGIINHVNSLAEKIGGKDASIGSFLNVLETALDVRVRALEEGNARNAASQIEYEEDRARAIRAVSSRADSVGEIIKVINDLFKDKKNAVQLSSVHRSKGLEWGNVFVLADTLCKWSDEREERNIRYVARTRTKQNLIQVRCPVVGQSINE